MSYYDDYDDDEYSSEDEVFYHNYSVDYANQLLGGHHAISSCLPFTRRKFRQHSPRLVHVATLDQMPIVNRHSYLPSLRSRPKYDIDENFSSPLSAVPPPLPPPLPSLEATTEELERRATGTTQPAFQPISRGIPPISAGNISMSENTRQPMTESDLRQVQQQQEAFQQHLLNMQRHLLEQGQLQQEQAHQEQQVPQRREAFQQNLRPQQPHLLEQTQQQEDQSRQEEYLPLSSSSTSRRFEKRTKVSYHDLQRDDDQAEIAELIENDPYFAAAMEDFARTHGLLHSHRHRTHSNYSSSGHSSRSSKRHRSPHRREHSLLSSSSSSSSMSSLTNVTSQKKGSKSDLLLYRELHGIRRLMEEYVRARINLNQPPISIMPWPITGGTFPNTTGVHYPPVAPVTDYQPSLVPPERRPPPDPNRVLYQNVVDSVKEVMDRRPSSQRNQPLKPSEIDPKLKHVYKRRPPIPPSNLPPTSISRRSSSAQQQQQQQQRRRRSSQMSTPPILPGTSLSPRASLNNIPPAPPYEALLNFSSSRPTINKNPHLSYGNREKQSNIYDTLRPEHYSRIYTKK